MKWNPKQTVSSATYLTATEAERRRSGSLQQSLLEDTNNSLRNLTRANPSNQAEAMANSKQDGV